MTVRQTLNPKFGQYFSPPMVEINLNTTRFKFKFGNIFLMIIKQSNLYSISSGDYITSSKFNA